MRYHDSYPDAQEKSKAAMEFLEQHQLAYNPLHYAVAYQHISGTNFPLSGELEQILSKHSPDPYEMEILFEKFISENKPKEGKTVESLGKCIDHLEMANTESRDAVKGLDKSLQPEQGNKSPAIQSIIAAAKTVKLAQEKVNKQLSETKQQTEKLKKELEEARLEAVTDPLTKLKNRAGMEKYLKSLSNKDFGSLCVLIADIDHFKNFNDEFGHLVGDLILKRLGRLLKEDLNDNCEAFRFGGEEFVILVTNADQSAAIDVAESIRTSVEKLRFVSAKTKERLPKMTISLGITEWQDDDELESAMMRADQGLYHAKQSGRNQVRTA